MDFPHGEIGRAVAQERGPLIWTDPLRSPLLPGEGRGRAPPSEGSTLEAAPGNSMPHLPLHNRGLGRGSGTHARGSELRQFPARLELSVPRPNESLPLPFGE